MAPSANPFRKKQKSLADELNLGELLTGDVSDLRAAFQRLRNIRNEWIREQIVVHRRFDLLAVILGYDLVPGVHDAIIKHQAKHHKTITLAWRGSGKTLCGTILKCIGELLCDRNFRIVIASRKAKLAENILSAIKGHFEQNELLREVFGDYVGTEIWSNVQILVKGARKEVTPSIAVIGTEGAIAGLHPNMLILDDPTEEGNSRTDTLREKLETWFSKSAFPTLVPQTEKLPWSGQLHIVATRYHPKDLVRKLEKDVFEPEEVLIIKPLDEHGNPRDPDRFGHSKLAEIRKTIGLVAYKTQFEMDDRAMNGTYFPIDNLDLVDDKELPDSGLCFMGVDLAPGLNPENDRSALVMLRVTPNGHRFVIDCRAGRWTLREQTRNIMEMYRRWKPLRIGIEAIAYQAVAAQVIAERVKEPGVVVIPLQHQLSKEQRAMSLTPLTDAKMLHFAKGTHDVRDEMVFFPNGDHDDFVDAVEFAQRISNVGTIRRTSAGRKRIIYGRKGRGA
jgi:predicted phage terminase large subunit-like protein